MLAFNLYTYKGINVTCMIHEDGKFSFRSILKTSKPEHYHKLSEGKEKFNQSLDKLL